MFGSLAICWLSISDKQSYALNHVKEKVQKWAKKLLAHYVCSIGLQPQLEILVWKAETLEMNEACTTVWFVCLCINHTYTSV